MPQKVHKLLEKVDSETTYDLGSYEIDFQDGALIFRLHAKICGEANCPCDNLQIDWKTEDTCFHTWYTSQRRWVDGSYKELHPEMVATFQIVEKLEAFQEQVDHLLYLRRRQVLERSGRLAEPFQIRIPMEKPALGIDPEKGIIGKLRLGTPPKHYDYGIEFCGDAACYCENLFLVLSRKGKTATFCVDPEEKWSAMDGLNTHGRLMAQVQKNLGASEAFRDLSRGFRTERKLHTPHSSCGPNAQCDQSVNN